MEKSCVVCGQGSHREKWAKTSGPYVACDTHTDAEIAAAVAAKTPKPAAPPKLPNGVKI